MKKLLYLLILWLSPLMGFSAIDEYKTDVYFGNGINTTPEDADKAGNEVTSTKTVTVVAPTFTSLSLESNTSILNVDDTVKLQVIGIYSDGSTVALDENIEFIITSTDSVEIDEYEVDLFLVPAVFSGNAHQS